MNAAMMPPVVKVRSDPLLNLDALVDAANGAGGAAIRTRAAALVITAALRKHPRCQAIFLDANFHDPIARAQQIMETHPFQDWTVGALARKVGMGRSSFAVRFLARTGKAPIEQLTLLRMERAAALLRETKLKVAEVGERVGYRSESAFNRRFPAFFKMTPGQMRDGARHGDEAARS